MSASRAFLKSATDRCVKCALCLPVCPTYRLTHDEAQSPRGRIALIQGLAEGALDAGDTVPHIDPCLACRACEKVCPADVPYGAILDRGRAMLSESGHGPARRERLAAWALATPWALRVAAILAGVARRWLPRARHGPLSHLLAMPSPPPRTRSAMRYPAPSTRGRVALLAGCVTEAFEGATNDALARLINACGYAVDVVHGCCGALHRHLGALDTARRQADGLLARLPEPGYDALVHAATGCVAGLQDHLADEAAEAPHTAGPLRDASAFLFEAGLADRLRSGAVDALRVALHLPCTQRNATGGDDALRQLIAAVPGVEVLHLPASGCCGAAGSKMLEPGSDAPRLAAQTLAPLRGSSPIDVLLSPNVGCAWHLRAALATGGTPVTVMHPALFLASRLGLVSVHRDAGGRRI